MCILNSNFKYAQIIYVWLTTCENEEKVLKIEIRKTTSVEIKIENKKQQCLVNERVVDRLPLMTYGLKLSLEA